MSASNKILTVSYGTFSCTLEGFDNPFGTMQSIAEYFRDLAAEDRYFGAEPPQPDAQMLHQIAEREVRRRVEARVEDSGVVLRQMPDSPLPVATTERDADAPSAAQAAGADAPPAESVADKLSRIRAVVAKARAERERTYAEDEPVEDGADDALLSAFAEVEDAELSDPDPADFATDPQVDDESEPEVTAADAMRQDDDAADGAPAMDAGHTVDAASTDTTPDSAAHAVYDTPAPEDRERSGGSLPTAALLGAAGAGLGIASGMALSPAARADGAADTPAHEDVADVDAGNDVVAPDETGIDAALPDADAESEVGEPAAAGDGVEPVEAFAPEASEEAAPEPDMGDRTEAEVATALSALAEDEAGDEAVAEGPEFDVAVAETGDAADLDAVTDGATDEDATEAAVSAQISDAAAQEELPQDSDADAPEADDSGTDDGLMAQIAAALALRARTDPTTPTTPDAPVDVAPEEMAEAEDEPESDELIEVEMEDDDGTPRLVTMTRAEFEEALAAGEIEEIEDDEEEADAADEATMAEIREFLGDTSIDTRSRDDLAAELAAIEAEAAEDTADAPPAGLATDDAAGAGDTLAEIDAAQDVADRNEAVEDERQEDDAPTDAVAQIDAEAETAPDGAAHQAGAGIAPPAQTEAEAETAEVEPRETAREGDAQETSDGARNDGDFDRLINETNAQMDAPEGNRRRSAIAHLKRAVAATKADGDLRSTGKTDAALSKFRDDLREVVRPRRPEPARNAERSRRPESLLSNRPAPLVLVSSQRVDAPSEPVRPVRPRRVSSGGDMRGSAAEPSERESGDTTLNDDILSSVTAQLAGEAPKRAVQREMSFSEFAADRGATELPQLLEAAAAYSKLVEGEESISRPQMLRRAGQAKGDMTREEGLTSFGKLLRSGRIRKVGTGRFTVTDDAQRTG